MVGQIPIQYFILLGDWYLLIVTVLWRQMIKGGNEAELVYVVNRLFRLHYLI